ncbi:hypothetical protein HMPREF1870_02227 [Bacteroidales bacterium KA00344]|nr:hypothetical protein HMPREF1870_02227 [Bacteroidales bacterium KA00344]
MCQSANVQQQEQQHGVQQNEERGVADLVGCTGQRHGPTVDIEDDEIGKKPAKQYCQDANNDAFVKVWQRQDVPNAPKTIGCPYERQREKDDCPHFIHDNGKGNEKTIISV